MGVPDGVAFPSEQSDGQLQEVQVVEVQKSGAPYSGILGWNPPLYRERKSTDKALRAAILRVTGDLVAYAHGLLLD